MATAQAAGTQRRILPVMAWTATPRPAMTGSVPAQNTAISPAPRSGSPVPAAVATKA